MQIMLAAYHGHALLVRLLISHGADTNRLNDRGQSPLAGAVFKNETEVIEALLEGGADPDLGQPSAMEAVGLFGLDKVWKERFESAKGRGTVKAESEMEKAKGQGGQDEKSGAAWGSRWL
jgi:ankyrin repeat protein